MRIDWRAALGPAGLRLYTKYLALYDLGRWHSAIEVEISADEPGWDRDPDCARALWLGVAAAQRECRALSLAVASLAQVHARTEDRDLLAWINDPPRRPRPRKNRARLLPPFSPGIGLSFHFPESGHYTAALVLAVKEASPNRQGQNYLAQLAYYAPEAPERAVFESRSWLTVPNLHRMTLPEEGAAPLSWHYDVEACWRGTGKSFAPDPAKLSPVCKIALRPDDPAPFRCFSGWGFSEAGLVRALSRTRAAP